jgi:hypothetical protein
MKIFQFLVASLASLLILSCEKAVEFKLDNPEPRLVIEASIENGQYPIVYLSRSFNYFSSIDLATLANNFVHGAVIYVSNGTMIHKLKEYAVPVGSGVNFYYYSADPSDPATLFTGELNHSYSLRVVAEGKEYTATTTIPFITKQIDSLFWKPAPGSNPPNKVMLMVRATDPPGFGDYIRYFTRRNSEPFYPGLNSVFDDQVIDGTTYELQLERGVNRNEEIGEGFSFFDKGDTVTFKLCNIDRATYDFWRTMEFTYASVGNPFATPTRVLSNISNGALGYFGGYACQFRTIIIPQ